MEDSKQLPPSAPLTGHKRSLDDNAPKSLSKRLKTSSSSHQDHKNKLNVNGDDVLGPEVQFVDYWTVAHFVGEGKERKDVMQDMLGQALPYFVDQSDVMKFAAGFCADPSHPTPPGTCLSLDQEFADDMVDFAAANCYVHWNNNPRNMRNQLKQAEEALTLATFKFREILNHLGLTRLEQQLDDMKESYSKGEGIMEKIVHLVFRIKREFDTNQKPYKRLNVILAVVPYVLMWAFVEKYD